MRGRALDVKTIIERASLACFINDMRMRLKLSRKKLARMSNMTYNDILTIEKCDNGNIKKYYKLKMILEVMYNENKENQN